jgi:predicted AAA+ superfamily ATPase
MVRTMDRYLAPFILKDLKKKMVFLGGPRQCGKTTFSKYLLEKQYPSGQYFNYDYDLDRKRILAQKWNKTNQLLIFDEIHKFHRWKNWVKGIYDTQKQDHHILVTGSARLDVYRRGGDSLLGRYHYWRMHPFTLDENDSQISKEDALNRLMQVGGFPEPFLENDPQEAKRWRKERYEKVLKEDLRDLENIQNISGISLLVELLKTRVGSLIVIQNLAQDLQVAPKTVKHWIDLLERMYLIFVVRPYHEKLIRAIQKPFKVYFFDNADVEGDEGAIFENLVATHLLKHLHFLEDSQGDTYQLSFLRDKEKREVDFVILKNKKVLSLIEVKTSDDQISQGLRYYAERIEPQNAYQIIMKPCKAYHQNKIEVLSIFDYIQQHSPFIKKQS